MDFLKQEIERKRKACPTSDKPAKKYKTRAERERELEESQTTQKSPESTQSSIKSPSTLPDSSILSSKSIDSNAPTAEQQQIQEETLLIAVEEVKRRLRARNQVITYFGESDYQRERRLVELEAAVEHDLRDGHANEFHASLRAVESELEKGEEDELIRRQLTAEYVSGAASDSTKLVDGAKSPNALDVDVLAIGNGSLTLVDEKKMCREDYVMNLLKKLIREWRAFLDQRDEMTRRSMQGKNDEAIYRQTVADIKPLFRLLKARKFDDEMLLHFYQICMQLRDREYVKANDAYLRMAIGNSPWPIGVTMVGIHERSAREKIQSNLIAHVLNDETQRKYIQAVKRLMTLCQKLYPNDPSKCVG